MNRGIYTMIQLVRKILRKEIRRGDCRRSTQIRAFVYAYKGRQILEFRISLGRARLGPGMVDMVISGKGPT